MKSQTSQVARSCRIREWAAMVQECRNRPNGMSVDEWCRANNITKANYLLSPCARSEKPALILFQVTP